MEQYIKKYVGIGSTDITKKVNDDIQKNNKHGFKATIVSCVNQLYSSSSLIDNAYDVIVVFYEKDDGTIAAKDLDRAIDRIGAKLTALFGRA